MRKFTISLFGAVFATIGLANAGFDGPDATNEAKKISKGGFVSGDEVIVTVAQINEMRDDVPVIVKGKILQRVGDEKYIFEDETGKITVEIDDDDWRGQTISPENVVKLYGDVDRGLFKTEVDIDYVEKL